MRALTHSLTHPLTRSLSGLLQLHCRALDGLVFSDPKAWRFAKDGDNGSLELHGKSDYNPKDRSPFNIALVADKVFDDKGKIRNVKIWAPAAKPRKTTFFSKSQ